MSNIIEAFRKYNLPHQTLFILLYLIPEIHWKLSYFKKPEKRDFWIPG